MGCVLREERDGLGWSGDGPCEGLEVRGMRSATAGLAAAYSPMS